MFCGALFFQHFYDHLKIYEQTLYRLLCEWRKKTKKKKTLKIAILCIFAHGVLCTFLFWTILKLATQSLLICIIIKVEAKRAKMKILCMCAPDLKKKLVNFDTSNNVTEPQVLYVHREDILNCSNIAVSMDTTQLKYHFLASPYWVCKIHVHIWHWFSDTFLVMIQNL